MLCTRNNTPEISDLPKTIIPALSTLLGLASPSFTAEQAPVVVHGTVGLDAVPFRALNRSAGAIECQALIAHWYSATIGRAGPGEAVAAQLWSDRKDGAVYLLNAGSERMPVQSLFCGAAGQAASTRSDIALARHAGRDEPAIDLECRALPATGALACRPARIR